MKVSDTSLLLAVLQTFAGRKLASAWQEWDYKAMWSIDSAQVEGKKSTWQYNWGKDSPLGIDKEAQHGVPRPRRGHSLVKGKLKGELYAVLFGGRDNDKKTTHIPKTYNVITVNGEISFSTYEDKPVNPCMDTKGEYYSEEARASCTDSTRDTEIDIGVMYNDVWAYKIDKSCERDWDGPCSKADWILMHPGALQGGCVIQLGIEVCNTPSERYDHGAVLFDDGCMYVYGGYSQRCQDYCDDIWFFDMDLAGWRQIYMAGELSHFYQLLRPDGTVLTWNSDTLSLLKAKKETPTIRAYDKLGNGWHVPIDDGTFPNGPYAGPGKRWRMSMVVSDQYIGTDSTGKPNQRLQDMIIFGGHRIWHGFSPENEQKNDWRINSTRQYGGYLNDLWIYTKDLDFVTTPGETFRKADGRWRYVDPVEEVYSSPGITYDSRFDTATKITWPPARCAHGSIIDTKKQMIWIFGGFSTYYPYPSTDGSGSGPGVTSVGSGGFIPYPTFDFYKNDIWYYNMSNGLWTEVVLQDDNSPPPGRMDMLFLFLDGPQYKHSTILMHGGYADNIFFDDLWYFNMTTLRWLEKKKFVYPLFPEACTDDFEFINNPANNCTHLLWPLHLNRSKIYPFEILPYWDQKFYYPDPEGPYWDIQEKGASSLLRMLPPKERLKYTDQAASGTPQFPYAASGPMQYARKFMYSFNSTHNATLLESCTSVKLETTRNTSVLDGQFGRSDKPIFIPIPRRRAPDWDGCRNGLDGSDMLQYEKPTARFGHRAIYIKEYDEVFMYGGMAYYREEKKSTAYTFESRVVDDFWYLKFDHCINNCSLNGDCYFGFCFCYVGYWGEDCSNSSCPGTSCYYDPITHEQSCRHACQAGYTHMDNDTYVEDIAKVPCSKDLPGEINGMCDGYGQAMCAPPFIGDDCSIKDCEKNCSFNGWCSIEYPVSRCMCNPGYFGDICQNISCLNNCSYPNGVCNTITGECECNMMYSPYNNNRSFYPWQGQDCSYIMAYTAASRSYITLTISVLTDAFFYLSITAAAVLLATDLILGDR